MVRYHRSYSLEFKCQVAQQYLSDKIFLSRLARQHDICRSLIRLWVAKYEVGEFDDELVQGDVSVRYEARIAELERKAGQLVMENDLLKKTGRTVKRPNDMTSSTDLIAIKRGSALKTEPHVNRRSHVNGGRPALPTASILPRSTSGGHYV